MSVFLYIFAFVGVIAVLGCVFYAGMLFSAKNVLKATVERMRENGMTQEEGRRFVALMESPKQ